MLPYNIQASLELIILPPLPPRCGDYRQYHHSQSVSAFLRRMGLVSAKGKESGVYRG
jgi:hypothetical protein